MSDAITITVYGNPATAGSKSIGKTKDGRAFVRPQNPRQKDWQRTVAQEAGRSMEGKEMLCGPLYLSIEFWLPRPKHHYGTGRNAEVLKKSAPLHHAKKPDLHKLVRAVEDALTGIVWRDDGQVSLSECGKKYGSPVRCVLAVRELFERE